MATVTSITKAIKAAKAAKAAKLTKVADIPPSPVGKLTKVGSIEDANAARKKAIKQEIDSFFKAAKEEREIPLESGSLPERAGLHGQRTSQETFDKLDDVDVRVGDKLVTLPETRAEEFSKATQTNDGEYSEFVFRLGDVEGYRGADLLTDKDIKSLREQFPELDTILREVPSHEERKRASRMSRTAGLVSDAATERRNSGFSVSDKELNAILSGDKSVYDDVSIRYLKHIEDVVDE